MMFPVVAAAVESAIPEATAVVAAAVGSTFLKDGDVTDYVDSLSKVDRAVKMIFPSLRFSKAFVSVFDKGVKFGDFVASIVKSGDEHVKKVVEKRSEIVSRYVVDDQSSVEEKDSSVSSPTLLSVLESNGLQTVAAIDRLERRLAAFDETTSIMFTSLLSILSHLGSLLAVIADGSTKINSSLLLTANNIDNIAILLSEIYGVMYDNKMLDKSSEESSKNGVDPLVLKRTADATKVGVAIVDAQARIAESEAKKDLATALNDLLDVFAYTKEKDKALLDELTFRKKTTEVLDMDGNVLVKSSPREVEVIKNASIAREKTDINNFELDDVDFDIGDLSNITLLDLMKFSKILQDVNNGS